MTNDLLIFLFHLIGFSVNGFGLWYDVTYISVPGDRVVANAGKGAYLTFWSMSSLTSRTLQETGVKSCLKHYIKIFTNAVTNIELCYVVQTAYFGYTLINDAIGSNVGANQPRRRCSTLQRIRDGFLASFAWPLGVFVCTMFWSIYAVDRELVFPKHLDEFIPTWLNHNMHSLPVPFMFAEHFITYHHYPHKVPGILRTLMLGVAYIVVIFWVHYHHDVWVYPIFDVLSWTQRSLFLVGLWTSLGAVYLLGEKLTNIFWGHIQRSAKLE